MIVLIISEYDEVSEVVGPFKDDDEYERYFKARCAHEPNFRAEKHDVKEPLIVCRWKDVLRYSAPSAVTLKGNKRNTMIRKSEEMGLYDFEETGIELPRKD